MNFIYKLCYSILYPFISLRYWHRVTGRENIPEGAALVCANHSSMSDPILVAFALTKAHQLHFMAKIELFRIPVLGSILRKAGIFPVDRSKTDVTAVKTAMKYLKSGEKVGIFPEGKRVAEDESGDAKSGAIRLAMRTGAPILPVYVPRTKRPFKRVNIVIGKPYNIELDKKSASAEDYDRCAAELMDKINGLRMEKA